MKARAIAKTIINGVLKKKGLLVVRSRAFPNPLQDQLRLVGDKTSPVVFDVGGNRGDSAQEYRNCFPDSTVHCFEPLPKVAQQLRDTFRGDSAIHVVECAIADHCGTSTFHVNPSDVQSSLLEISVAGRRSYEQHTQSVEVQLTTIDEYCAKQHIEHVDLLKMDIQGAEAMALRGAGRMLDQHAIDVVFLEAWFMPHYSESATFCDLASIFSNHGYKHFGLYNMTRDSNGQLVKVDAIFISRHIQNRLDQAKPSWRSARMVERAAS